MKKLIILTLLIMSTAAFSDDEFNLCIQRSEAIAEAFHTTASVSSYAACATSMNIRQRKQKEAEELKQKQSEAAQKKIDDQKPHLCVAACVDQNGSPIRHTYTSATGKNLEEATSKSEYLAATSRNCTYSSKVLECDLVNMGNVALKFRNIYAEAVCSDKYGYKDDQRTITGAKGYTCVEAKYIATWNLEKKGIKCILNTKVECK